MKIFTSKSGFRGSLENWDCISKWQPSFAEEKLAVQLQPALAHFTLFWYAYLNANHILRAQSLALQKAFKRHDG